VSARGRIVETAEGPGTIVYAWTHHEWRGGRSYPVGWVVVELAAGGRRRFRSAEITWVEEKESAKSDKPR
jgi:hypothetical protein